MSITQILSQATLNSRATRQAPQQQQYRSRLRRKAENLLQQQAKGKYFNNQQRRIVARWQRLQLRSTGEVTA